MFGEFPKTSSFFWISLKCKRNSKISKVLHISKERTAIRCFGVALQVNERFIVVCPNNCFPVFTQILNVKCLPLLFFNVFHVKPTWLMSLRCRRIFPIIIPWSSAMPIAWCSVPSLPFLPTLRIDVFICHNCTETMSQPTLHCKLVLNWNAATANLKTSSFDSQFAVGIFWSAFIFNKG